MSTIKDDPFYQEGQQAAREHTELKDCPYPEGTDGQNGWMIGWRSICPECLQCHAAVHRCQGSVMGKLPKDPAKQSKAANARWTKWRHARALAYHKRQEQEQFPTAAPVPAIEPPAEPEPKKTWRW